MSETNAAAPRMDVEVAPDAKALRRDAKADTVIIGSGIAGLSTAYELSGQGQKVIVVDRGRIGSGMTARTTAHLTANNDDGFKTMIDRRGELAKEFYVSQAASISPDRRRSRRPKASTAISAVSTVSCFPGRRPASRRSTRSAKASEKAGMPVEAVVGLPLSGHEKTGCLRYPDLATFHPTKYLRGLAVRCIERHAAASCSPIRLSPASRRRTVASR